MKTRVFCSWEVSFFCLLTFLRRVELASIESKLLSSFFDNIHVLPCAFMCIHVHPCAFMCIQVHSRIPVTSFKSQIIIKIIKSKRNLREISENKKFFKLKRDKKKRKHQKYFKNFNIQNENANTVNCDSDTCFLLLLRPKRH